MILKILSTNNYIVKFSKFKSQEKERNRWQ